MRVIIKYFQITQAGVPKTLSVSATTLNVAKTNGSTATFDVTSNTNWNVTSDQSWLTASPSGGMNNATVTLTATESNPFATTRTATVTISADGLTDKTVTVTQEAAPAVLTVSTNTLDIAATVNSTVTFNISSNTSWTITSDQTWLTANPAGGANNYTVTLTATEANPTTATRAATVTIASMGVENKTVTVTQAAGTSTGVNSEKYSVITLYPNPTTNGFTIETEDKPAALTIHTLTGSLVKIQTVSGKTYVDVSDLKAGAYLVKVNNKTAKLVKKGN